MFAAGAATGGALLLGTLISTLQWMRASRARQASEVARLRADSAAQIASENAKRADLMSREAQRARINAEANAGELRQNLYVADSAVAGVALQNGNLGRAAELVRKYLRVPSDEEDPRGFEWRYLWQHCQGDEIYSLPSHIRAVTSVAFSVDGTALVSGGFDTTVRVWDWKAKRLLRAPIQFHNQIERFALTFSPDRKFLALRDYYAISIWDTTNWKKLRTLEDSKESGGNNAALSFSSDARLLAASTENGVQIWDVASWNSSFLIKTNRTGFGALLAFLPDRDAVVINNGDRLEAWNVKSATREFLTEADEDPIVGLAVAPTNNWIAVGKASGAVRVFDGHSGKALLALSAHARFPFSLAFSPDGRTLATGGADQLIRLWDVQTLLASSTNNSSSHFGPEAAIASLLGHENQVWALAFSPDGQTLASGSKDGGIKLWNAHPPRKEAEFEQAELPLWSSPDGSVLLFADSAHRLHLWDVEHHRRIRTVDLPIDQSAIRSAAASSDGQQVALGFSNGAIEIWDLRFLRRTHAFKYTNGADVGLEFSSDHHWLIAQADDAYLWNLLSPDAESPEAKFDSVESIGFSRGSHRILMVANERNGRVLREWNLANKQERKIPLSLTLNVSSLAFSPDDTVVALGCHDNTVRLCNTTNYQVETILKGNAAAISSVDFSTDGRTLVTYSTDGIAKLWNTRTGREIMSMPLSTQAQGWVAQGFIGKDWRLVRFFPDGNTLALASLGSSLTLWRVESLTNILKMERAKEAETAAASQVLGDAKEE